MSDIDPPVSWEEQQYLDMKHERDTLRAENARLREALRFYADPQTYGIHGGSMKRILEDSGDMAKAALTPAGGGQK